MRSSLILRSLLTAALSLPLTARPAAQPGEPQELRDLHYGEVLFQLYQENYFQAIVHLLSARKQGLMQAYEDEPELLLGGLYLAYGMPDTSEEIFQRVLAKSASPELQNRAWLQLAKSRHRRDDNAASKAALGKVGDALDPPRREESLNLLGLLQMLDREDAAAIDTLGKLTPKSEWSRYAGFNLALAQLRRGERERGLSLLREIGDSPVESEEEKAIRDRANLVVGYLMLEAQQPDAALEALRRVRLYGPSSNQALLGAGWASLQKEQPEQALVAWQQLAERTSNEAAVFEVQLAIPYALAKLDAQQQSLQGYRRAIDRFNQAIQELDGAIEHIRHGGFPDSLLREGGDAAVNTAPDNGDLRTQLPLLFSKNAFQERLQDYRDLHQLERNLRQWQEKIDSYRNMLAVQIEAYRNISPKVDAFLKGDTVNQLVAERDDLQTLYERAGSPQEPPFILTTEDEKRWLAKLDKINGVLDRYEAGGKLEAQREGARLMRGILIWRTVTEHPARIWTLKKQMAELDRTLEKTRQLVAELSQAREQTRGRFETFTRRIETQERGIPSLLRRVGELRRQEALTLQEMAVAVLEERKTLLHDYLIQARFGVASLLDSSGDVPAGGEQ